MNTTFAKFREIVAPLSPAHRRWKRFLRNLPLDPDKLARPVAEPSPMDFVICGAPRTGTTLLCALLFQPPEVVTVMEPWDGMRLAPVDLFASLRSEIEETGQLRRGKLDVGTWQQGTKVKWAKEGEVATPLAVDEAYYLGVKWPAYWRYLDLLPTTKFLVCVRNPQDVVASFKRKGGRLALGLEYDIAFNRQTNQALLKSTQDPVHRRILLYEHIYAQIVPHIKRKNVLVMHYERWFTEPEAVIAELNHFLGLSLQWTPASIQPSKHTDQLERIEIELLQKHCPSAKALGYDMEELAANRMTSYER